MNIDEITPDYESSVLVGYEGRCKLTHDNDYSVFPNAKAAYAAANIAVNPTLGGYAEVKIEVTDHDVTHESALDWYCN